MRGATRHARAIDSALFTKAHYPCVGEIISRAEIRVAGPPGDELTIYGFAVLEPGVIHLVYTKKAWRRLGIAKALLAGVDVENTAFSTWSQDVTAWIQERFRGLRFRPYWMEALSERAKQQGFARPEGVGALHG